MKKIIILFMIMFGTLFLSSCSDFDGKLGSLGGSSSSNGDKVVTLKLQEDTKKTLKNDLYEDSKIRLDFTLFNFKSEKNDNLELTYRGISENNLEEVSVENYESNSETNPKYFHRFIDFKNIDNKYSPDFSIGYCYKSPIFIIKNVCIKSADSSGSCNTKILKDGEVVEGGFSILDLKLTNTIINKGKLSFKMKKSENFVLKNSCEDNTKLSVFTFDVEDFEIVLSGDTLECSISGQRYYPKQNNPFTIICDYENKNSDISSSYSGILSIKFNPSYSVEKILEIGNLKINSID